MLNSLNLSGPKDAAERLDDFSNSRDLVKIKVF